MSNPQHSEDSWRQGSGRRFTSKSATFGQLLQEARGENIAEAARHRSGWGVSLTIWSLTEPTAALSKAPKPAFRRTTSAWTSSTSSSI